MHENIRLSCGVFLISLTALMLELVLIRVFDVLFNPASSYLIVSCAIYSFGLSGLYVYLKKRKTIKQTKEYASKASFYFAVFVILILACVNILSALYRSFPNDSLVHSAVYVAVYICISIPFFLAGSVLASIFSSYHREFHILYFWDLLGASIGCVIFIPFLPNIGPGGLLFIASAFGLWASRLFMNENLKIGLVISITGCALLCAPFFLPDNSLDFRGFDEKRRVVHAREIGAVEKVVWDPVSKIEVINQKKYDDIIVKHIAYDGGNQSSHIYPFDGNFENLRKNTRNAVTNHFWQRGVLASHYIKQGDNNSVLIIGSAGGQETKAALLYGAKKIDAVELVSAVVQLGKFEYADFNGNIFNDPRVSLQVGEGRAFLRRTKNKYDIIQIFSNHTSSSIASGNGLISSVYLQTVEAYKEYFDHLNSSGVLHINHHLYPRIVTTAAKAWVDSGYKDFQKHIIIFEREGLSEPDTLPTLLIKMSPWTKLEVDELKTFFLSKSSETYTYNLVANPLERHSDANFLSPVFFSGDIPEELEDKIPYNISPPTDDKPFFNFFRKNLKDIHAIDGNYYTSNTAGFINNSKFLNIPRDLKSLFLMLIASVVVGTVILFLPLIYKNKHKSTMSLYETIYFSLLGFGFISLEFVFIQMFIKIIGNPLYSFSTIIFTLLISAGLGSLASNKLASKKEPYKIIPFICILVFVYSLYVYYDYLFSYLLAMELPYRILFSSITIFPLGFFLGMPLPLGMRLISQQDGQKVPWAWALNGFFTVFGGFLTIISSLFLGFKVTLFIAFFCYCLVFVVFKFMNRSIVNTSGDLSSS